MSISNEDLVNAIKKHPVGFGCGFLVIALGVGMYLRSGNVPELTTTLEDRSAVGLRQQTNIKNGALLDEQLAAIEAAVAQINERAVDRAALANNLQYFYQLEAEHGVKIVDLRPDIVLESKIKTTYTEAPFVVSAEGTYRQLLAFIRAIEQGRRFARIDSARFEPSTEVTALQPGRGDPVLEISVNVILLAKS